MGHPTICVIDECERADMKARGLCRYHYHHALIHGYLHEFAPLGRREITLEDRLHRIGWTERVVRPELGACWEWNGAKARNGYGAVEAHKKGPNSKKTGAHRAAYETWVGPIPEGHDVRHRCDNTSCIRPEHLETGTRLENVRDMVERRRVQNGERAHQCKITDAQVEEIRAKYIPYVYTQRMIAEEYGVTRSAISSIINGYNRRHRTFPEPENYRRFERTGRRAA